MTGRHAGPYNLAVDVMMRRFVDLMPSEFAPRHRLEPRLECGRSIDCHWTCPGCPPYTHPLERPRLATALEGTAVDEPAPVWTPPPPHRCESVQCPRCFPGLARPDRSAAGGSVTTGEWETPRKVRTW